MNKTIYTEKIVDFLTKIGIKTQFSVIDTPTFLPGIKIDKGDIFIDRDKLLYPGDLLHEAGHLAVSEKAKRVQMGEDSFFDGGEEIVAILWSYAAAKAIDLPLTVLFHIDGYKGQSDWLIESFENQVFVGLPLLEWMGLTAGKEKAKEMRISPFPNMIKWLRD